MLKGAGAATFLADYYFRGSPASFLLFAASDGLIAAVTLYALLSTSESPAGSLKACYAASALLCARESGLRTPCLTAVRLSRA